ncbi:Cytochrome c family protein [Flavobacterium psychrophilum]|uniref:cytochrome C n=1 Tax=Flavobacterium psychrophilum TaxID=96345 RepID=UPI000B7C2A00|nr:cytochrome C [Flavobacterium psychrophilum]EKT4520582.1 cytochrome C [Flavobacterium psychrophilum]ELI6455789.1 cytochrome C [Flavobacterium psychrophilum]SNB43084.1 Cytochrome c family protein [Flavobacterium psychrophilum]
MDNKSKVIIFVDNEIQPIGKFEAPVNFELDTHKLPDGLHQLKIVSKDPTGKEGIKIIPFIVRNGPAITIEGLNDNDVVDGVLPLMINAYGKGNQKQFLINGSETPKSVPSWLFAAIIAFVAWAIYFTITSLG